MFRSSEKDDLLMEYLQFYLVSVSQSVGFESLALKFE